MKSLTIFVIYSYLITIAPLVTSIECKADDSVYKAPDPEPTPEETLVLEFVNRFRADPGAEGLRMAPLDGTECVSGAEFVNQDMFRREMKELKPAQPLVFHLGLIKAARCHCHYITINGYSELEEKGKLGYTGNTILSRAKNAGFEGYSINETMMLNAVSPWECHWECILDYGPDTKDGMKPGRPSRMEAIIDEYNIIGCGYLFNGDGYNTSKLFATIDKKRYAGGVAYIDKNGNGFYDLNEGVGGVKIICGSHNTETWKSGAYTLLIEEGAGEITASIDDFQHTQSFNKGKYNIKYDAVIFRAEDIKEIKKRIADLEKIKDTPSNSSRRFKAAVKLYVESWDKALDTDAVAKVKELTLEVDTLFKKARSAILESLSQDSPANIEIVIKDHMKDFSKTVAGDWFKDAQRCAKQKTKYLNLLKKKDKGKITPNDIALAAKTMKKEIKKLKTNEWKNWLINLAANTVMVNNY